MKVDSHELGQIAQAASQANATPRMDMYAGIHKAVRSAMCDTLVALGRVDTDDATELAETAARLRALLDLCAQHLDHENTFVHPALEARAQGTSFTIAAEHVEHERHLAALESALQQLERADAAQRPALALALYRELSLFIAENFHHMQVEETVHNAALWAHYSDDELMAIEGALVASIPPEQMMAVLRWLVPSLNPAERLGLLGGMRANAPAPAFEAALETVRPHLDSRSWDKLCRGLGLATA